MSASTTQANTTALQDEAILDALHEPGRPWMYTREIAAQLPWAGPTISRRLQSAVADGLVETRGFGRGRQWRLA